MIQEVNEKHYSGVLCSCCRQPIPLPAIVVRMQTGSENPESITGDRVFSLRCRACEREMPYRTSQVLEIEGAPRSRVSRATDRARLLKLREGMSRAANG